MGLLSRLGLGELVDRPPRERATFFFLVAMSTFLFMDQNLMAPNLSAIGEELLTSQAKVEQELRATDPTYQKLLARWEEHAALASDFEARLGALKKQVLEKSPGLDTRDEAAFHRAVLEAAGSAFTPEEVTRLAAAGRARQEASDRVKATFQGRVDEQLAGRAALWFWLMGGLMTLGVGYLSDKVPRKLLLFGTIIVGALPCLFTGFARNADEFIVFRALTGIGIGAVLPLTYSILGDLFSTKSRASAAAWVFLATGVGIAVGQLFAGMAGPNPALGWRMTFIIVAIPNLFLSVLFLFLAKEPARGGAEHGVKEAIEQGSEYEERIKLSDFKKLFANKTNLLVFFQGIPGSVPWGFFFTYLVDFYHTNKGYSVQDATLLVTLFGGGAILGGFLGGLLGNNLYNKKPAYLPLLCGVTIFLGMFPMFGIVNWSNAPSTPLASALDLLGGIRTMATVDVVVPMVLGFGGAVIATMTSSNVKAILMDVNVPENRGTIFSFYNLSDDLGKGLATFIIGVLSAHLGRLASYNVAIGMWAICAAAWMVMVWVFPKDAAALERVMEARAKAMRAAA